MWTVFTDIIWHWCGLWFELMWIALISHVAFFDRLLVLGSTLRRATCGHWAWCSMPCASHPCHFLMTTLMQLGFSVRKNGGDLGAVSFWVSDGTRCFLGSCRKTGRPNWSWNMLDLRSAEVKPAVTSRIFIGLSHWTWTQILSELYCLPTSMPALQVMTFDSPQILIESHWVV